MHPKALVSTVAVMVHLVHILRCITILQANTFFHRSLGYEVHRHCDELNGGPGFDVPGKWTIFYYRFAS